MCQTGKNTADRHAATREVKMWKSRASVTISRVRSRPNKFVVALTAARVRDCADELLDFVAQPLMRPNPQENCHEVLKANFIACSFLFDWVSHGGEWVRLSGRHIYAA